MATEVEKVPHNHPPVTVIVTVLNEADTIEKLLVSLEKQELVPQEIIITDGGSSDATNSSIQKHKASSNIPIRSWEVPGNRSQGRNAAISAAHTELIAITDAGCEPRNNWLAELVKKQQETHAHVVAGYYKAKARTRLQTAIAPYALVMPDRVDPAAFLPATRSMLLTKSIWEKAGKFDERLSDNEDYAFAKQLLQKTSIAFCQTAVVDWHPPTTISAFARMIFRFARGDIQASILRPKVILIFVRYLILLLLLLLFSLAASVVLFLIIIALILSYIFWSVSKNYKYAKKAWYWLPVLQIISDMAVMAGSLVGLARFEEN